MSTDQYIELEGAISVVEKEGGGSTMTAGYATFPKSVLPSRGQETLG
jgi:hypothetical protein